MLIVLFSRYICILFGTDAATQSYILKVLPQFAAGFVVMAVNVMISACLYSTERSLQATSISALRSIVVDSVVILILPQIFGEGVIWFSLLIYESIVLVFAVTFLKHSERNGICFKK